MDNTLQNNLEQSIPALTEELICSYCAVDESVFSWKSCVHYGATKGDKAKEWTKKLSSNVDTFDKLLANFLVDTFDAQMDKVQSTNDKKPFLLISIARHSWPMEQKTQEELIKVPGIQALPGWLSMGDYDSIFKHTLAFFNLLKTKLSHLKHLTLVIYVGSNAVPCFAFNDALSAWVQNKKPNWSICNMYYDEDYEYEGISSNGFHLRPNAAEYWNR